MSASNAFENKLNDHIFRNAAITLIGDAAGLLPSAAAGSLYISLHTADPGEAGDQSTSETTYPGYARVAVARTTGGWGAIGAAVANAAAVTFPASTGGPQTITHFGIGASSSGTGLLLMSGTVTPNLVINNGITPEFAIGQLTETVD